MNRGDESPVSNLDFQLGQLVRSAAGRDQDAKYLVVRLLDDRLVAVADGETRPLERPKKKNCKHLESLGRIDEVISGKLGRGEKVTDEEIRRALREVDS